MERIIIVDSSHFEGGNVMANLSEAITFTYRKYNRGLRPNLVLVSLRIANEIAGYQTRNPEDYKTIFGVKFVETHRLENVEFEVY